MKNLEKWKSENFKPEKNLVDSKDYLCGYVDGLEAGYQAALEWVKKEAISLDERGDISRGVINRELES